MNFFFLLVIPLSTKQTIVQSLIIKRQFKFQSLEVVVMLQPVLWQLQRLWDNVLNKTCVPMWSQIMDIKISFSRITKIRKEDTLFSDLFLR